MDEKVSTQICLYLPCQQSRVYFKGILHPEDFSPLITVNYSGVGIIQILLLLRYLIVKQLKLMKLYG